MLCRLPLKRESPPKHSRRKIKARGKFKAFGLNPSKTYKRKRTDAEVMEYVLPCQQERLRNRTRGEMAFAQILDQLRIHYDLEKISLNGDRAILVDFYLPKHNLAIEIDGSLHHQ